MYNERNKLTLKKFEFTCELGRGLVMTFIQKCQSLVGFPDKLFEKWEFLLLITYLLLYQTIMLKIMNNQQQENVTVHNVKKVFMEIIIKEKEVLSKM